MGVAGSCAKKSEAASSEPKLETQMKEAGVIAQSKVLERSGLDLINSGESIGRTEKALSIKSFARLMHDAQKNEYIKLEDIKFAEGKSIDPPLQLMELVKANLETNDDDTPIIVVEPKPPTKNKFRLTLDIENDSKWLDPVCADQLYMCGK
jgi:hypothetical protein